MPTSDRVADKSLETVVRAEIEEIGSAMDLSGVGVLHSVIPDSILEDMRSYIERKLEQNNGQYFGLGGVDWIEESPLNPVFHSEGFHTIVKVLHERAMGTLPASDRIVPVLRVLAGTVGLRHANLFHYDSFVVTAVVPIIIPQRPGEPRGHLVVYPNLRNVRTSSVVNILEKAVVESTTARRFWRAPWVQRRLGARVIPLEPSNMYFFWGMRSLHANQACLPESVRSTVLLHFGDPHEKSIFKKLSHRVAAARQRRLARL